METNKCVLEGPSQFIGKEKRSDDKAVPTEKSCLQACRRQSPKPPTHPNAINLCMNAPQVVTDFVGEYPTAVDCGEDPSAAKQALAHRQVSWLKRKAGEKQTWRPRKRHRVAACKWGQHLDQQVLISAGVGLKHFQQAEEPADRPAPWTWPRLSIAPDMGSDWFSMINALQGRFCFNVDVTYDPSHGVWDDIQHMLKMAGLGPWTILMMVVFNVPSGPWADDARFQQVVTALGSLFDNFRPSEAPLFQHLSTQLIEEMGATAAHDDESPEQIVWNKMKDNSPWRTKGEKVVMNRFMGFIVKGRRFLRSWFQILCSYLYAGLEMDFFMARSL